LEIARALKARGDTVIAACRKSAPELDALGVRVEPRVDASDANAIVHLADRLRGVTLDNVFLNAGVLERDSLDGLDKSSLMRQFEVNAVAPLLFVKALAPNLKAGSKVQIVTSRMGSIADNGSGGYYGYRMSKCAVNMACMSLAHDLRDKQIAVMVVHPGFVKTQMTNHQGNVTPEEAASGMIARLADLTLERSGEFRHMNGEPLPW